MFYPIQQILPDVLNTNKNWHANLLKNWNEIIGQLSCHMRLEKVFDNTIIIGVYEPQWMQELFLLSKFIIDKINTTLGQKYIINLKFKLVEKHKPDSTTDSKARNTLAEQPKRKYELNFNQTNALNKIQDEQLKESLYKFLLSCTTNY